MRTSLASHLLQLDHDIDFKNIFQTKYSVATVNRDFHVATTSGVIRTYLCFSSPSTLRTLLKCLGGDDVWTLQRAAESCGCDQIFVLSNCLESCTPRCWFLGNLFVFLRWARHSLFYELIFAIRSLLDSTMN